MTKLRPASVVALLIILVAVLFAEGPGSVLRPSDTRVATGRIGSHSVPSVAVPASDPFLFSEARADEVAVYLAEIAEAERAAAEHAAREAQQIAGAARSEPQAQQVQTAPASSGDCANPIIPESVAMRESGCSWSAYNPTGCGGRGCLGFFQLDLGHFAQVSPWNSSVSGGCVDLAAVKWAQWAQIECASRLGAGAWG